MKRVGRGVRTERTLQPTTKIRRPSSSGTSGSPTGFHRGGGAESPLGKKGRRSLEEMGRIFECPKERVRQIEARALRKLRRPQQHRNLVPFSPSYDGDKKLD